MIEKLGKFRVTLMIADLCLLIISTILFVRGKDLINVIPLYISMVVVLLNTQASRYGVLLGGFNAILYALIYFIFGLYSQTLYALLFSFPMQIITFCRWSKRPYGDSTVFKRLTRKQWFGVAIMFGVVYAAMAVVFTKLGSDFVLLDNFLTLVGILSTALMMLSYIDYTYLYPLSAFVGLFLGLLMALEHPERTPWLVHSCYNAVCSLLTFSKVRKLYQEQQEGRE